MAFPVESVHLPYNSAALPRRLIPGESIC